MDVGTVSSEDVLASYGRQLAEAHQKIAMLEAALEREKRNAALARISANGPDDGSVQQEGGAD